MEVSKHTQEEEDIMCGGGSGYWFLWRFKCRGVFTHVTKGGAEVLGRYQTKEGAIIRDGDPAGEIKRVDGRKVSYDAIG